MTWEDDISNLIDALKIKQSELLLRRITASFMIGIRRTDSQAKISTVQRNALKALTKEHLGYLVEFDEAIGNTLTVAVKTKLAEGGGYSSVKSAMKPSIEEVFGKDGLVKIDRTGQTRRIVEVGKDGLPYWTEKTITKPYSISVEDYSKMLSRTTTHAALEAGRIQGYKSKGVGQIYRSVADERTRPAHLAMNGTVITPENESLALSLLSEPNCRCRLLPYFDDTKYDTPQSVFAAEKEKAGLIWDDDIGKWSFKE